VLDPSLWISGVLNDVFILGLPGIVELYQFINSGHVLFCTLVLQSADLMPLVGASFSPNLYNKVSSPSPLQFVFGNYVAIRREPYVLNSYKFLISALSLLPSGMLHYRYFVTALKLLLLDAVAKDCIVVFVGVFFSVSTITHAPLHSA